MTKRKTSMLLLVAICLTLLVGAFVGCNNIQIDEAILNALNEYFQDSEVEVQHSFGEYNDATVVLVKSNAIADSLRNDTINGIEFDYAKRTQLLVVQDEQVYTLKQAYLNLLLDSTTLREIRSIYNNTIALESSAEYSEIGTAIVLEEKKLWDESDLDIIEYEYLDDTIEFSLDENFNDYSFGANDFPMLDIKSISCIFEGAFFPGTQGTFWIHRMYAIKLNNSGRENLKNAIRALEQLDFVQSARLSFLGIID